ncbi:hypothetical protein COHA_001591 [Chlorella ohadii]|uniref:SnoaL-like domain-containing protein n=1 Tax=Chlorella ohadii TaxID=2649997 RepID=A0AAD5DZ22_9CHLO|nr:hypothetical protein COHA_001591 [Chlorella ohadii]
MPSSAILQAAKQRLEAAAAAEAAEAAAAAAAQQQEAAASFVEHYKAAVADSNDKWALEPAVADLFAEDAALVTADGQTFSGRPAVLKRLNHGVQQLATALGGAAKGLKIEGGELEQAAGGGGASVTFRFKQGVQRMSLHIAISFAGGHISKLQYSRG